MNTLDFFSLVNLSDSNLHVVATASLLGLVSIPQSFYEVQIIESDNTLTTINLNN